MQRWLIRAVALLALCAAAKADDWDDCAQDRDLDRAIRACSKVIESGNWNNESLALAYYDRGLHFTAKNDHSRAITDYDKAIELRPDYADAYVERGRGYEANGEHGRAIADLTRAIELDPGKARAYYNRAVLYRDAGDKDLAIADFTRAIEVKADYALAYANRGYVYYGQGDYDEAAADYQMAITLDPQHPTSYYMRGLLYAYRGDSAKALADLRIALSLYPPTDPRRQPVLAEITKIELPLGPPAVEAPANTTVEAPSSPPAAVVEATAPAASTVDTPARSPQPEPAVATDFGRRVALVVANAAYEEAPLQNPTVDADLIEPVLKRMGFGVTVVKNANLEKFVLALHDFYADAKGADVALFYFAGHGFAINGQLGAQNYLMSTSADVTSSLDEIIRSGGVAMDEIIASITGGATVSLVFVDACRNDPRLSRGAGRGRGLARIDDIGAEELFVGLSTRLGDLAEDGEAGDGSPFARAFAKHMPTPDLPIGEAFRQLRLAVVDETDGRQRPEARDDLNSALIVKTHN